MAEPFAIATQDPRFDPQEPVKVNGYLFVPANPERAISFAINDAVVNGRIVRPCEGDDT